MTARSSRAEVRNPILALPSFTALQRLDKESARLLRALLLDLRAAAKKKAAESLSTRKYMMFSYWQVVAVYAGHTANALR